MGKYARAKILIAAIVCGLVGAAASQSQRPGKDGARRAAAQTKHPQVGDLLPAFSLKDTRNKTVSSLALRDKILVLEMGALSCPQYLKDIPAMNQIAKDFKGKAVEFYVLYTREPNPGEKKADYDFSGVKQTETSQERVANAVELQRKHNEKRAILIDTFGATCVQNRIGGGQPNSMIVVDRDGKVALWQGECKPDAVRTKLQDLTNPKATSKTGRNRFQTKPFKAGKAAK